MPDRNSFLAVAKKNSIGLSPLVKAQETLFPADLTILPSHEKDRSTDILTFVESPYTTSRLPMEPKVKVYNRNVSRFPMEPKDRIDNKSQYTESSAKVKFEEMFQPENIEPLHIEQVEKIKGVRGNREGIRGQVVKGKSKGNWFKKKFDRTAESQKRLNKCVSESKPQSYTEKTPIHEQQSKVKNLVFASAPIESFNDNHNKIHELSKGMRGKKPNPINQIVVSRPRGSERFSEKEAYQITDFLVQSLELEGQGVACFAHYDEKKKENALHIMIDRTNKDFIEGKSKQRTVISSEDLHKKCLILLGKTIKEGKSSEIVLPGLNKFKGIDELKIKNIDCPVDHGIICCKDAHENPENLVNYLKNG